MAGDLMNWAQELKDQLYGGSVNAADIAAARREAEMMGGGLQAMPAGTWTPSMDWYKSVKHLQYVVAKFKKENPGARLDELEGLAGQLNAFAEGEAA
jgi:hypothetical protein